METVELLERIEKGEDSRTQFKENIINPDSLEEEMVAFSNTEGGIIVIGVTDKGDINGLSREDIGRLNNMISNVSSEHVKPPINPLTEIINITGKNIMVVNIKRGINKPYSTKKGVYLAKSGADKRKISQEELLRLFQESQKIHADESIIGNTSVSDLDKSVLNNYFKMTYGQELKESEIGKKRILENLYILKDNKLTLAGLLTFGKDPQSKMPLTGIKAVSFVGTDMSVTSYRDSDNINGNIEKLFRDGLSFLTRNLLKKQNNKNFNTEGDLEIPVVVLEELLVNAIIHRDYYINSSVNLFIFDDRIEIISPGKLPNNLTVDNIRNGISVPRNPILITFASKILPYRGIGTGIVRSLRNYKNIQFENDTEVERFKAIIYRER